MKLKICSSLILSFISSAYAVESAATTPVGICALEGDPAASGSFTTGVKPGMNIVGLRLHQSVITGGSIKVIGKDFAELSILEGIGKESSVLPLTMGKCYILEITSGEQNGVIQEISRWQGSRLALSDDLAAAGVKPGDTFNIRPAATLNSVFHPLNCGLLSGANAATADNVMIPQGTSLADFRLCFILRHSDGNVGWVDAVTLEPIGDAPLIYPDGLIIHRRGNTDVNIMTVGTIKSGLIRSVVEPGLNLVATPSPLNADLQSLGLENDLQKSDDATEADKVWVACGKSGRFTTYYLTPEGRWVSGSDGEAVTGKLPVGSAILIERVGPTALFCLGD